jgi:hypothetical protein
MEKTKFRAHFDGRHVLLDEACDIPANTPLIVSVVIETLDEERQAWSEIALQSLARAYDEDEPEYSLDLIKEPNPDYEAR